MDLNLTVEALATVAGLAIVLELFLELFLKRALAGSEEKPWYALCLNVTAFVVALILCLVYEALRGGLCGMSGLQCFLTALGATAVSVLGYETFKNIRVARNGA